MEILDLEHINTFDNYSDEEKTQLYGVAATTKLSKNFTLAELLQSNTAKAHKIDNTIPEKYMENVKKLVTEVLQPIRDAFGSGIRVSSGYRCDKVNSLVGGANNSDHRFAAAADIQPLNGNTKALWDCIIKLKNEGKIKTRLIIWEYGNKKAPKWVHIAVNHKYNAVKNNQIVYIYK